MMESVEQNLGQFRLDISCEDNKTLIDRYYYSTISPVLTNEKQASLKRRISDEFGVSMRDILLVGSAKLGFTLLPKRGRPPLTQFGDDSDIDIAIISGSLFVKYWQETFSYWIQKKNWDKAEKFREYLFRGWLRPDKLPTDPDFKLSDEWFEFFRGLQFNGEYGGYKIAAGIYLNERFWEEYAASSLAECRNYLEELK